MTYQEFQKRYKYDPARDRIGKGGFGTVYKAYDNYLDNYVAIKMSAVSNENDTTRLANEVKLASKLPTHPNIAHYQACYTFTTTVGVYDFGVLNYYEDGNLEDLIKLNVLTDEEKISILKQILNGIGFLHKNKVVHRDLKPRNILIARRGDKIIPKITDFGISKEFEEGHSTAFGNSITGAGTLAYSSPEQLNEKVMHRNTDLWSYGVIAYQIFTGELPFNTGEYSATSSQGRVELFRQINSGELPPAANRVPEPWNGLIRRLLVVDTKKRLRNCAAVKEYLTTYGEEDVLNNHEEPDYIVNVNDDANVVNSDNVDAAQTSVDCIKRQDVDVKESFSNSGGKRQSGNSCGSNVRRDDFVNSSPSSKAQKKVDMNNEELSDINSNNKSGKGSINNENNDVPDYLKELDGSKEKVRIGKKVYMTALLILFFLIGMALYFIGTSSSKEVDGEIDYSTIAISMLVDSMGTTIGYEEPVTGLDMIRVPAGTFTMGATSEQVGADKDELPTHTVTLGEYYISSTEVTQAQWKKVMGTTLFDQNKKSDWQGIVGVGDNFPMYHVSWKDAMEFCQKLSSLTGKTYTLPTEAQWEYAARGANRDNTMYSGSRNIGDVAWYNANSDNGVHAVAQLSPNALGLYDMSGNVWEWCYDWYGEYSASKQENPQGPENGTRRVLRGGSWNFGDAISRISNRADNVPTYRNHNYGFRIIEVVK